VVDTGALIGGSGTTGGLTIHSGGYLSPGSSPDQLFVDEYLVLESGANYIVEVVTGNQPGDGVIGYDQVVVAGTVSLDGANLLLVTTPLTDIRVGQQLTIIDNDASDPVVGLFASLAEGAEVLVEGLPYFTISYVGGGGRQRRHPDRPRQYHPGADRRPAARLGRTALGAARAAGLPGAEGVARAAATPARFSPTRSGKCAGHIRGCPGPPPRPRRPAAAGAYGQKGLDEISCRPRLHMCAGCGILLLGFAVCRWPCHQGWPAKGMTDSTPHGGARQSQGLAEPAWQCECWP